MDEVLGEADMNRQYYSQLPGDAKASSIKATPSRTTGKKRCKYEKYSFGLGRQLAIIRLVVILILTIHNVIRKSDMLRFYRDQFFYMKAFAAAFEFMGHVVERCIQLNDPSSSFLLCSILVFVEWLARHQDIALGNESEEKQARARSFLWKNCVTFFNMLMLTGSYPFLPLEDRKWMSEFDCSYFKMTLFLVW